jgi:hypothetical protein
LKRQHLFALLAPALFALGVGALAPACSSPVQALCSEVCECEHCSELREADLCQTLETAESVAGNYGCAGSFSAWLDCLSSKAQCVESGADWTTVPTGRCNAEYLYDTACTDDAECWLQGHSLNSFCASSGKCASQACSYVEGRGNILCETDADCVEGQDACAVQAEALRTCQGEASGHGGVELPQL